MAMAFLTFIGFAFLIIAGIGILHGFCKTDKHENYMGF